MENTLDDVRRLVDELKACRQVLTAHGDETRLHLLGIMLQNTCSGSRVIDIAAQTNLSRPAVSHHLRVLKDAGIVKSRREGTCIYYYLDPEAEQVNARITLFCDIREFMKQVPDRSGDEE